MKTIEAIQQMIDSSGVNASQLSTRMGKHRNFVASTIYNGSTPRTDTLAHMADIMGYELVLRGHGEEIPIDPPGSGD